MYLFGTLARGMASGGGQTSAPRQWRAWTAWLVLYAAATGARAEAIRLTLQDASPAGAAPAPVVRISPGVSAGPPPGSVLAQRDQRNTWRDLQIDLREVPPAGQSRQAWAWSPVLGELEHRLTARADKVGDDRLTLHITGQLRSVRGGLWPARRGQQSQVAGQLAVDVTLQRRGSAWVGRYQGELSAQLSEDHPRRRLPAPLRLAGEARGKAWDFPVPQADHVRPGPGVHPRLLLGRDDLPTLRQKASQPAAATALAALADMLQVASTAPATKPAAKPESLPSDLITIPITKPAPPPPEPTTCWHAAGWALLGYLQDDRYDSAAAAKAAEMLLTPQPDLLPLDRAERLAALAVAYDIGYGRWDENLRKRMAEYLASEAWSTAELSGNDAPRWVRRRCWDDGLAALRAAAGLAALAVANDAEAGTGDQVECATCAADVARRSVRRYLQTALGQAGWPTGHTGCVDALALVLPYVQAARRVEGIDLARGTGARRLLALGAFSNGLALDASDRPAGTWLSAACAIAPPDRVPQALGALMARGRAWESPWHAILAFLNEPGERPASATSATGGVYEDRTFGGYGFRSAGGDQAMIALIERAGGPASAAGRAGQVTLAGLGRLWLAGPQTGVRRHTWPRRYECNVVQIRPAALTRRRSILPVTGAALCRAELDAGTSRGAAGPSGSVSMANWFFREEGSTDKPPAHETDFGPIWRTVGVDLTGASGAQALLVFVDQADRVGSRQKMWQVCLGRVALGDIQLRHNVLQVRPAGSKATMTCTVLAPASAVLRFVPANHTRGAWLQAWWQAPKPTNESMLHDSMARKAHSIANGNPPAGRAPPSRPVTAAEMQRMLGYQPTEAERKAVAKRRKDQASALAEKLHRHTISVKPRADDPARTRQSMVVVVTVQTGRAPSVQVPRDADGTLLTVGSQVVRYDNRRLTFGPAAAGSEHTSRSPASQAP